VSWRGLPIQYRIGRPDIQTVQRLMQGFAAIAASNLHVGGIVYDWNEPGKVLMINIDQDRARQLGISSQDIATHLNLVGGSVITQVKDSIYLIDVIGRARSSERVAIETFQGLQLTGRGGELVPLPAIGTVEYELKQPMV